MPAQSSLARVLHAVSQYGVVSEGFVVDAVGSVEPHGWESWVLCRDLNSSAPPSIPPPERIRTWSLPDGLLASRWARQHIPGLQQRAADHVVGPTIERIAPRVIHAHFGWNLADVVLTARRTGVPLVATFHASDVTIYPTLTSRQRIAPIGWRSGNRYGSTFGHVSAGIAVSDFIAAKVRGLGFDAPVQVIPAGIRLEEFEYRPPHADPRPLRVLFVGRLVRRKGLDVLLEAVARTEAPSDLVLSVIGDGPERASLERLAARLGIADRVTFLGARARADVIAAMRDGDILVMPSRTMASGEVEGSPVVTKEAQAIGLPVIATDNGGTRETLPPEHRADVVPEEDPVALARALSRASANRESWPARCAAARRFVEEQFGWDDLGRRTAELYDELASGSPR